MANILKQQIDKLANLQKIEMECIKIGKLVKDVPERVAELENSLKIFEQEMDNIQKQADEIKKEYRKNELDVKENLEKVKKSKGRLGEVKNNKEYQSILKEIDEFTKKNEAIEEKMLGCLESADQTEAIMKAKKIEFESAKVQVEMDKKEILADNAISLKRLEELEEEKADVLKGIQADMMDRYERVKTVVGKLPMARAKNSICLGCNMNMPPQRYNELLKCEEIILCPHCHRILHWVNENERSE
ncbi:MAG: hypothetical protein KKF30_01430 [Proteobacteria bacterium]|nr:hypothetical protein [Pseudomonadota bacterium]MBU4471406.1 hypothetical protein [Pseudomonadota bacterium]MCG2752411.1 C4-type zinc ribbon domain-containing protein [Desulfobacteraceae bacterium]